MKVSLPRAFSARTGLFPAAEPGVDSRASWRDAQHRAGSATFPGELPESPSAVLCVDKPTRTSSSFVAL